jgi:hypothetical protein
MTPNPMRRSPAAGVISVRLGARPAVPKDAPPTLNGETPWYIGSAIPVQEGVYKRLSVASVVMYSLWADGCWHWNCVNPWQAASKAEPSLVQHLPWCGLLAPPAEGYGQLPLSTSATPATGAAPC